MKHEKLPIASVNRETRPTIVASIGASHLRPLGYPQSLTIGFVTGCLAFLLGNAGRSTHEVAGELVVLLAFAGGGAALAMAANFIAERRIRAALEARRAGFARYMFGSQTR